MSEETVKKANNNNQKYDTIEEVAAAMGVEINDQTSPFLARFVKKDKTATAGDRKKVLLEQAAGFGVEGLNADTETADSIKLRIIAHLLSEQRIDEMKDFANANKLVVDLESGRVFRAKTAVKSIEDRVAGQTEGSIGNLSILLLQDERYADKNIAQLVDLFPEFAEEQGYPGKKTTAPSLQWYVNYARKHDIEIIDRKKAPKVKLEGGKAVGVELTLDKALAPKGFAKRKAAVNAPVEAGEELSLEESLQEENQE